MHSYHLPEKLSGDHLKAIPPVGRSQVELMSIFSLVLKGMQLALLPLFEQSLGLCWAADLVVGTGVRSAIAGDRCMLCEKVVVRPAEMWVRANWQLFAGDSHSRSLLLGSGWAARGSEFDG